MPKKSGAEWIQATRGRRTSAVIRADRARPMGPTGRSRCSGDSPVEVRCARRGLAALGFSLGYLCSVGTQADEANHPLRFWPALRSTVEEPRKKATTAPHLATLRHVSRPCRPYPTRRCPIRTNLRLIPAWTWRSSSSLTSSTSRRASTSLGLASCGWKPPSQPRRIQAGSLRRVPAHGSTHAAYSCHRPAGQRRSLSLPSRESLDFLVDLRSTYVTRCFRGSVRLLKWREEQPALECIHVPAQPKMDTARSPVLARERVPLGHTRASPPNETLGLLAVPWTTSARVGEYAKSTRSTSMIQVLPNLQQ